MSKKFETYRQLNYPIPEKTRSWNMYGAGIENIGRDGKPEEFTLSQPADDQILVRVDAVGMCFSDVKLIKQGGAHPKLYNRDLANNPTRVGHEAAVTVIQVGKDLTKQYFPGQRLAIQPDIYQNQMSTAYGYSIPGGLIQYHLIGPEVLDADGGAYVIPIEGNLGYAEVALTEPWACVEAAYTQRRRLTPKNEGIMWIIGQSSDTSRYTFTSGLDAPSTIVVTDIPEDLKHTILANKRKDCQVIERPHILPQDYPALNTELREGRGFDDIIVLQPCSAEQVSAAAKLIGFRGTFNLVGNEPLDGEPLIDVGRIHYHYTTYIGSAGTDIAASYGENRNRCGLRTGGTAVFVGAGGPMGQMHVQRALELEKGPALVIATEVNDFRLAALEKICAPLAAARGKRLLTFNPAKAPVTTADFVNQATDGHGADDAVVCVPIASLMEEAARLLVPDGMLVFFAGVPAGTFAHLDLSRVYLHNLQLTGTSGSTMDDQRLVIRKTLNGQLSPNRSVAAVGGIESARDGIQAMMTGVYAGKVLIFPQISGLPLVSLDEFRDRFPDIGKHLGENNLWTREAEKALIEKFWTGAVE
ncbi:MAG: zinc-binding dehydrogenase [Pelolinea sp.]|nr:zinc-binding dehydrogenase [Pelolinea sp.]